MAKAKKMKITGAELAGYRCVLRLSQSQLAKSLGVPRGTVASWEAGRGSVPLALGRPLHKAAGLTAKIHELLAGALSEAPAGVGECWK